MFPKTKFQNNFETQGAAEMAFSKMTWSGLMVVAFGWMLLLSGGSVQILLSSNAPSVSIIAQCTIISGFGLALLGALQTGFSALTRFFDSVLQRKAARQDGGGGSHIYEAPASRPDTSNNSSYRAVAVRPARMEPVVATPQRAPARAAPAKMAPVRAAAPKTTVRKVLERGWWKDRAYTVFLDGSVEIETLLGLRRFACMTDAQDFIG
jgi:hypothetical protein